MTGSDAGYGVTADGFVPKPFAQLLTEKFTLAREVFGTDLDLAPGSTIRTLLEITALEDARTWTALAAAYDNTFVSTATGDALSALGAELGLPRPRLEARGRVRLTLVGQPPPTHPEVRLPRGVRLLTPGGHHAALAEAANLSAGRPQAEVAVAAFHPGPGHNLDPAVPAQRLDHIHPHSPGRADLDAARQAAADPATAVQVRVEPVGALRGGERCWSDERYRALLLAAPRALWTTDAIQVAVSLVPGVRQVRVRDAYAGLDVHQSVLAGPDSGFLDRLFREDPDLTNLFGLAVLVAPTTAAIWSDPQDPDDPDTLRAAVQRAVDQVRPAGVHPRIELATEVTVAVTATVITRGVPGTTGSGPGAADSPADRLRTRLMSDVAAYIDGLRLGEPVRHAVVLATLMRAEEVADVTDLRLWWSPAPLDGLSRSAEPRSVPAGSNVVLAADAIAVCHDDPGGLVL